MARSHPPTLLTRVRRVLGEECAPARGDHLMLAVSGGPDSMALLHVLAGLRSRLGFVLSAHGVNHGLREAALRELEVARDFARAMDVPFSTTSVQVRAGSNLQSRARQARYRALHAARERAGADFLVTAHHADDRAETVLIRMLRGSSVSGLGVLQPRAGQLLRPMVRSRKAQVQAHIGRHTIPHCHDPSNLDQRFLRVRVRRELIPLLEQLSPAVVDHLNHLADDAANRELDPARAVSERGGRSWALNRSQAAQLARIERLGLRGATVRLAGGREIRLDPQTLAPFVTPRR